MMFHANTVCVFKNIKYCQRDAKLALFCFYSGEQNECLCDTICEH